MDYSNLPEWVIEKFWANVEKTNYCWNWGGYKHGGTSPCMPIERHGRTTFYLARRVSLALSGTLLPSNCLVHPLICHNNICVNPDHLVYGDEARFWAKVQKLSEAQGGCWVWTGYLNKEGYGKLGVKRDGRLVQLAHIYSWELANNHKVRTDIGMVVMHKCDHPWCVNPDHLSIGTHAENSRDREEKGRGSRSGRTKLTEDQVRNIVVDFTTGNYSKEALGRKYMVSGHQIHMIVSGKAWVHLGLIKPV